VELRRDLFNARQKPMGPELVLDEEALTARLAAWLGDPAARAAVVAAATETIDKLGGALDRTLAALDPYLMQLQTDRRQAALS